ncbi:MAG: TonB-dependent receptor, partial [Gammaproteobacteria bacterium]|nr:TonB-dependent receptor [Gammaproteobacteria bacterium]
MKNIHALSRQLAALLLGSACFGSSVTLAAETQVEEEVVVTARRTAESLSDVPMALTAFTAAEIEDAGIQRPEDFINLTPNVVMANTANIGDTQVTIRGITSTRDAESNFALVVDGVLITNPNAFNRELLDVAQIEVLKGPQGALYGRNASSGAILITTNRPDEVFDSAITIGGGNYGANRYQGHVSGELADNLYGRFSFSHRESDGEQKNLFQGGNNVDFLEDDSYQARLIYDADSTKWDFRVGYAEADSGTINFNATFAIPAFTAFGTPGDELFYADVNEHNFQYMFNTPPLNEQEREDMSLKVDHSLDNGMTLTAILAVSDLDEKLLSDGTSAAFGGYFGVQACADSVTAETLALVNSAPPGFLFVAPGEAPSASNSLLAAYTPLTCDGYQYQERNQSDKSFEIRLASAEGDAIQWLAGMFYATIEREVVVAYGADLGQGFLAQPYVSAAGPNPTDLLFWDDFDTTVTSVFGQMTMDLQEDLELSIEARYDREDREVHNKVPYEPSALLYGGGAPLNPARSAVDEVIPDRDAEFSQFQPKVALRYDVDDDTSVYASYGVGFRSGGFNSIGSQAVTDFWFNTLVNSGMSVQDEYDKEVTRAFELGLKGSYLDGRLKVNAVFQ